MITAKKIFLSTIILTTSLAGCSKNEKTQTTQADIASVAEAQVVPMSAIPADEKTAPTIINDNHTTLDLSSETTDPTIASTTSESIDNTEDNEVDNSAMENISEDAEIIDDEPASPNAPIATDMSESVNQKVH